jgi:16S rRNA (cytidine1402-2'-O)-methyltransferase
VFLGFLRKKTVNEKELSEADSMGKTVIFYESPHRILKLWKFAGKFSEVPQMPYGPGIDEKVRGIHQGSIDEIIKEIKSRELREKLL